LAALFQTVLVLNALFFLFYGLQCFRSPVLVDDFRRFGLPDSQRILTGVLQLLGSAGLITGIYIPILGILASGGLSAMMLVAFFVRVKVGDGVVQSAPSLIFLVINAWLCVTFYNYLYPAITGV
jgi:hypothetical protein